MLCLPYRLAITLDGYTPPTGTAPPRRLDGSDDAGPSAGTATNAGPMLLPRTGSNGRAASPPEMQTANCNLLRTFKNTGDTAWPSKGTNGGRQSSTNLIHWLPREKVTRSYGTRETALR